MEQDLIIFWWSLGLILTLAVYWCQLQLLKHLLDNNEFSKHWQIWLWFIPYWMVIWWLLFIIMESYNFIMDLIEKINELKNNKHDKHF